MQCYARSDREISLLVPDRFRHDGRCEDADRLMTRRRERERESSQREKKVSWQRVLEVASTDLVGTLAPFWPPAWHYP
jgi:hypothetical protein